MYAAASGEGDWRTALDHVARAVSGDSVVLFAQLAGANQSAFLGGVGVTSEAMRAYTDYYASRNVLMRHGAHLHYPGIVRTSERICSADTLLRSEYFNDFMRPNGQRFALGLTVDRGASHAVHLTAFRGHGRGAFGPDEQETFGELYPHLRQAVRLASRLESAQTLAASLQLVGDVLDKGVALLDAEGGVLLANACFEAVCADRDGLSTAKGKIAATGPGASAFTAVLAHAVRGGAGGTVVVPRISGRSPYSVLISPVLTRLSILGTATPRVSLIVTDTDSKLRADVIGLQQQFGLTRAEARLATRIARGATVRAACEDLHISIHTGRTHLKRVMAKIGVSRQADLVRVLLSPAQA